MVTKKKTTKKRPTRKKRSFADSVRAEAEQEAAAAAALKEGDLKARLRQNLTIAEVRIRDLEGELADFHRLAAVLDKIEANSLEPFRFQKRERSSRKEEAVAVQLLSDLHLEEKVDPAEVNGLNEFNLEIATKSMESLAVGTAWMLKLARAKGGVGYSIRDLLIPILGDVITGLLRSEDLGNFLSPFEASFFAAEQITCFVKSILHECPWLVSVYVPIIGGNHERLAFSKSTPFRERQKMSFASIIGHILAKEFRDDKRVVVEYSPAEHIYTKVYGYNVRGMHGDRFGYQSGVGGIFIPARRHIMQLNKMIDADLTFFGHWHTSKEDDNWVSNGSLIGPNTYSIMKGMDPEPPSQTFLIIDKSRGKRLCTQLHCRPRTP